MELHLRLKCHEGTFDPEVSQIALLIKNVTLPDKLAKATPGRVNTFEELTIPLGISGPLTSPKVDSLAKALLRGTLENVSKNEALKDALNREAEKLIRKLVD